MSPGIRILLWAWPGLAGLGGIWCLALALRSRAASRLRWSAAALAFGLMTAAGFWVAARTQQPRARDHYYAALDDKRRGDLESAREKLREALQMDPGDPAVRQELQALSRPARSGRKESSFQPVPDAGTGPGSKEKPEHPFHDPSPVKITDYRLRVALRPEAHTLSAQADLTLKAIRPVREIPLSLGPEFHVTGALDPSGEAVAVRHTNDLLVFRDRLRQGESKTYRIHWKRIGKGERLRGGDAISPRGTYLRPEARWYPATGELDFRSPVRLALTLPQGYTGVSVGRHIPTPQTGKSVSTVWETTRPAAMIPLVAGHYAVKSLVAENVPIRTYLFPRHERRADAYLQEARSILAFYASRFGPYPFEKLAIAEIPYFPGGYGSTSLLMLTEESFVEETLPVGFLAHEIAHQWWGNSVFPQGPGCGWLSEAFAEYASYLYMEYKGGKSALKKCLRDAARSYWADTLKGYEEPIAETDPYDQAGAYRGVIYFKGAYVLHSLRSVVGDEAFFRILRAVASKHAHGKLDIETFMALSKEKSGRPLNDFYNAWLRRSGAMRLSYGYTTSRVSSGATQVNLTIRQEGTAYPVPLQVALISERGRHIKTVDLQGSQQTVTLEVPGAVTSVDIDPEEQWLKYTPRLLSSDALAAQAAPSVRR